MLVGTVSINVTYNSQFCIEIFMHKFYMLILEITQGVHDTAGDYALSARRMAPHRGSVCMAAELQLTRHWGLT